MDPVAPVELDAGPLWLRPWREDDIDAVMDAQQDDAAIRLWAGGVTSRTDAATLLRRLMF